MEETPQPTAEDLSRRFDIRKKLKGSRRRTGWLRTLPDFIIIGGHRCGSTSLYSYLTQHPAIVSASLKEIHFFDLNFQRGLNWYRAHFPYTAERFLRRLQGRPFQTGEATPFYLTHPHCPRRAAEIVPGAKIVAILRNPIDRAYSHYHHQLRKGLETLPFEEAIDKESERIEAEWKKMLADPTYYSFHFRKFSYLRRGHYADQLAAWMEFYPREKILVLKTEDLEREGTSLLNRAFRFLGLPSFNVTDFEKHHLSQYAGMDPAIRKRLADYFAPHNRKLEELTGEKINWT
ncbi:sulfotransferase domain-containing protein [Candidatus Sumerlaeota bacterium]|nr:sulfotransferase domain-containing protein [Candidatus Sumerlaeota bacterium]